MKRRSRDKQLDEFEKNDLGSGVKKSRSALVVLPKSRLTTILLPDKMIHELRQKASRRGIGYQTMLKIILSEQMRRY